MLYFRLLVLMGSHPCWTSLFLVLNVFQDKANGNARPGIGNRGLAFGACPHVGRYLSLIGTPKRAPASELPATFRIPTYFQQLPRTRVARETTTPFFRGRRWTTRIHLPKGPFLRENSCLRQDVLVVVSFGGCVCRYIPHMECIVPGFCFLKPVLGNGPFPKGFQQL